MGMNEVLAGAIGFLEALGVLPFVQAFLLLMLAVGSIKIFMSMR
jgi:hypothetical protein